MTDPDLSAEVIPALDDATAAARAALETAVDRLDALRELGQIAGEIQAEIGRPPTVRDLLDGPSTEVERARVRRLIHRATGDPQ